MTIESLTPREKAAILIISLGQEHSAKIYKHLNDEEIEQLTLAISTIRRVDPDIKEAVINEFYEICMAQQYISEGGIEFARQVLDKALGSERAMDLISRLSTSLQVRPFDFIRKIDPTQIINFLQNEYPQTIALILSYLEPKQAATVLGSLPTEKQAEVIARVATMGAISPEYIKEAERILERKISTMGSAENMAVGGIESIVNILNSVDRSTEKNILESLEVDDADLADEIRRRMFMFEDVAKLTNQAIQRVLKEVENSELSLALKGATAEVSKKIFDNTSKRLQEMIKEDMEFMGPVRVKDVEAAQQKIVNIIRKLEDAGEIIVSRGQEDEVLV